MVTEGLSASQKNETSSAFFYSADKPLSTTNESVSVVQIGLIIGTNKSESETIMPTFQDPPKPLSHNALGGCGIPIPRFNRRGPTCEQNDRQIENITSPSSRLPKRLRLNFS